MSLSLIVGAIILIPGLLLLRPIFFKPKTQIFLLGDLRPREKFLIKFCKLEQQLYQLLIEAKDSADLLWAVLDVLEQNYTHLKLSFLSQNQDQRINVYCRDSILSGFLVKSYQLPTGQGIFAATSELKLSDLIWQKDSDRLDLQDVIFRKLEISFDRNLKVGVWIGIKRSAYAYVEQIRELCSYAVLLFEVGAQKLESLNRNAQYDAKSMSSQLCHDLRSPLNNIKAILGLLVEPLVAEEREGLIQIGLLSCSSMKCLVDNLVDFALSGSSKPICYSDFDLSELLNEVVREFLLLAKLKKIDLSFENAVSESLVRADRLQLKRVLINLLSNAVKYTEIGSVRVSLNTDAGGVFQVSITDTGSGIDFCSVRNQTQDSFGLGLNVVRELLRNNHSELEIGPSTGSGTTVSFKLKSLSSSCTSATELSLS